MKKHDYRVKIFGAGSIGNHLAFGCRSLGLGVSMVDTDPAALERTKTRIYPDRYGQWDESIKLYRLDEAPDDQFDLVIIGTPPASHLELTLRELAGNPPALILIEKPLCVATLADINSFLGIDGSTSRTRILVGYNQRYKENTKKFVQLAKTLKLGRVTGLNSNMLESWNGILGAHFWMRNEFDSYLPFTEKGGGALHEHSHALDMFLFIAQELGQGHVTQVKAEFDWVEHESGRYDQSANLKLILESGLSGSVRQDLTTWPPEKELVASFEKGNLIWSMDGNSDSVKLTDSNDKILEAWNFPKTRPDDFIGEITHLVDLLESPDLESHLSLEHGIETMQVIYSALESNGSNSFVSLLR